MLISRRLNERGYAGEGKYSTVLQTTHRVGNHSLMVTSNHSGKEWSATVSVWTCQRFETGWSMLFQINDGVAWANYDELHERLIEKAEILLTDSSEG